jgi:hypothetical protein
VIRGLRHRAVQEQLRQRDAGDRRVERILAGARGSKAAAQQSGHGVQIHPAIGARAA